MAAPLLTFNAGIDTQEIPNLADLSVRADLSPAALAGVLAIADRWGLKNDDLMALLGGVSNGRFYEMKKSPESSVLTQDELTRISLLIGIFEGLGALFSEELADRWISLPNKNPMFANNTPLQYAINGGILALYNVRRLIESRLESR